MGTVEWEGRRGAFPPCCTVYMPRLIPHCPKIKKSNKCTGVKGFLPPYEAKSEANLPGKASRLPNSL